MELNKETMACGGPKVSVVMPAYNAEKYLREAIDSILNQTYGDFEFIIINDGSTDNTEKIILSYDDPRIVYLKNEINSKIVVTLNKGINYASGQYIVRMDADDISMPERIEKQVQYMDAHPEVAVLGTAIKIFGDDINEQVRIFNTNSNTLKADLLFSSCIAHPTVIIRKNILDKFEFRYDEDFAGAEDYHLWWRIAAKSKIAILSEPLLSYRIHPNQITQQYTDEDREILGKLLEIKMNAVRITLTELERKCFLMYSCGEFGCFEKSDIKLFIDILARIIKNNTKIKYFETKALQNVCGLAVTYTLLNSKMTKAEQKECYKYAIKSKVYSRLMQVKLFYHRTFL